MSLPTLEPLPDENTTLPPARRRRQRRMLVLPEATDRGELLTALARQSVPSVGYFAFSLVSGLILGLALLLDAPALVFLAVLLAPFMAPAIGISLGTVTGIMGFILQSVGSLGIGSLVVFLCGAIAGWAASLLPGVDAAQVVQLSQFHWATLLLPVFGAALSMLLLLRDPEHQPQVPSLAIAYSLYVPVSATGFGLTSGTPGLWPDGLVVFLIHLLLVVFTGVLVLSLLGIRPLNTQGYVLSGMYGLCAILLIVLLIPQTPGPGASTSLKGVSAPGTTGTQTQAVTTQVTHSPSSTLPVTHTPIPSATSTATGVPSPTPSMTITPVPTPVMAVIFASEGGGALIREEPNYDAAVLQSILNETRVEVLPDTVREKNQTWLHIRLANGKEGWILQSLLRIVTPVPTQS